MRHKESQKAEKFLEAYTPPYTPNRLEGITAKKVTDLIGFMINDAELPAEAISELSNLCPEARWDYSKWMFTYRDLTMDCSPSADLYCLCVNTLMYVWRNCIVDSVQGLPAEQLRGAASISMIVGTLCRVSPMSWTLTCAWC